MYLFVSDKLSRAFCGDLYFETVISDFHKMVVTFENSLQKRRNQHSFNTETTNIFSMKHSKLN